MKRRRWWWLCVEHCCATTSNTHGEFCLCHAVLPAHPCRWQQVVVPPAKRKRAKA
jgi:hypothetical protein